ncbi:MAG TPA: ATP-binding protein, partial [Phototrophicaceae bacterium]|nr:ATP-binding protein [Phototrophicaceae bacterium]
ILQRESETLPDLILSDIMMPQMDGLEFLRRIRQQDKWVKIPFIFLTARGEKTDIQQGKVMGVDDYLIKPYDADDLLLTVESKLRRHQKISQVQEGQIQELKRNILTILNHEFRTPLTLVVAYADMLKGYDSDAMSKIELMEFLKGVNSGAERLRRLIENFILLVELETGDAERTYQWRKHEMNVLEDIVRSAHRQAISDETRPRVFEFKLAENLPAFTGDHEYLVIALRELIDNAIKFSARDQTITIGTSVEDNFVCIWVKDEGRGIPETEQANIWNNFYQINREHFEDQGTGTGLALVRGIARLHQGKTRLVSKADQGSCFTLMLPVIKSDTSTSTTSSIPTLIL